jgi:hypothetical protein
MATPPFGSITHVFADGEDEGGEGADDEEGAVDGAVDAADAPASSGRAASAPFGSRRHAPSAPATSKTNEKRSASNLRRMVVRVLHPSSTRTESDLARIFSPPPCVSPA